MTIASDGQAPPLAPHQCEAVDRLRRILRLRRGAVLADEPGLGKTWVAATIARERSRRGDSILVVVPAALRSYWRGVLARFDVQAEVVSHERLARSTTGRHERGTSLFVVVDEAHRFRNALTKRYEGLARLSINARLLLVTATPVCNSPADLRALFDLIVADDELAVSGVASIADCFRVHAKETRIALDALVVRRSSRDVRGLTPSVERRLLTHGLSSEGLRVRTELGRLTFPWIADHVSRELLVTFLDRRLESSVAALRATVRRMRNVCLRARHLAERGVRLTAGELRTVLGDPEAGSFQDILFPELWGAEPDGGRVGELDEEAHRLDAIARRLPGDPKLEHLEEIVRERRGTPGLVFSVSYDTVWWLYEQLAGRWRCALLTGRRCLVGDRRCGIGGVVDALANGAVDLVLATDVGGEGLNLQSAGYVVHVDQPWNPATMEQRIGRVCRIGQRRARVESIELIAEGSRSRAIVEEKRGAVEGVWAKQDDLGAPGRGSGWRLPARIEAARGQARLARQIRLRGLAAADLAELLSVRYRVGPERWIEWLVSQPFGTTELENLREILANEERMIRTGSAAI